MNSMDKYAMKKDIQWLGGWLMMIIGVVMIVVSVSPLPGTAILESIAIAISGFGLLYYGHRLFVKGGGAPVCDGNGWPPKF